MAKREVPDFDAVAAFDKALAQQKPDLAARLGSHTVAEDVVPESGPAPEDERKQEPLLKIVPQQRAEVATKRKKRSGGATDAPVRRRGIVARANGEEMRRLTVYVDLALAHQLRKYCFDHELNLSEVAAEALSAGLETLLRG
jgi:hypothetical protein